MNQPITSSSLPDQANEGRREGLAMAALALAGVAFLNLLGLEKALLAAILAYMAIRGSQADSKPRRLGMIALCITAAYILTFVIVLITFRGKVAELIQLLQQLG